MKSDAELIQDVARGDKGAFEAIVRRHQRFLMKAVARMTRDLDAAEDIVQETFIKAFKRLHLFEGRSALRSWLYQIALNTTRNRFRKHHRESTSSESVEVAIDSKLENQLVFLDIRSLLQGEIAKLPERQRQALSLRIFDDLSFKEIAEIMHCPYDTAKANYRHALLKLRGRLESNTSLKSWSESPSFSLMDLSLSQMEVDG